MARKKTAPRDSGSSGDEQQQTLQGDRGSSCGQDPRGGQKKHVGIADSGTISSAERQAFLRKMQAIKADAQGFLPRLNQLGKTKLLQAGYLTGSVMFDWWESIAVCSLAALTAGLIVYGAVKQLKAGATLLHGAASAWQASV